MPIKCNINIEPVGQDQFHLVDKIVMRHAFDIHNTIGSFCDEHIYQTELCKRCRDSFDVHSEVLIRILHQGFSKAYFIDMLVDNSIIYELKATSHIHSNHQKQLINYLMLTGTQHGKLINFRSSSVESSFVSTGLNKELRHVFQLIDNEWQGNDKGSQQLRDTLYSLLEDWGAFLDITLYTEALIYFNHESEAGVKPVDISINDQTVGIQSMNMIDSKTAWHLSAVRDNKNFYETHIGRLLKHTSLNRIHWINFEHHKIILKTITK